VKEDRVTPRAEDYEYITLRAESHEELTEALNDAAEHGWEPAQYAVWSYGSGLDVNLEKGVHFVILRRDTAYFDAKVAEVSRAYDAGEYDGEEAEWAQRFLERAREDGYGG